MSEVRNRGYPIGGPRPRTWIIWAGIAAILVTSLILLGAADDGPIVNEWIEPWTWALASAWGLGGLILLWWAAVARRSRAIALRHPRSLVLETTSASNIRRGLETLGWPSFTGFSMTMEADETGIRFWGGSAPRPEQLISIPWNLVTALGQSVARGYSIRTCQLDIGVHSDGVSATLSAPVFGWGFGGMYSPNSATFSRIIADLEGMRATTGARSHGAETEPKPRPRRMT